MPHLLLFKGHPATGKSSLARALAQKFRWPLIDKDDVKDFTYHLPGGNRIAYDVAWQIAGTQLSLGLSVIVDTPLSYSIGYETGKRLAEEHRANLLVIETKLDHGLWQERLETRQPRSAEEHKIRGWQAMQSLLEEYDGSWRYFIEPEHLLKVDTSRPVAALVEQITKRLGVADEQ